MYSTKPWLSTEKNFLAHQIVIFFLSYKIGRRLIMYLQTVTLVILVLLNFGTIYKITHECL